VRSCTHCGGKAISITYCVCVFVCSLSYPTCNAHAPYCNQWPVWPWHIFPYYLIICRIKKKKLYWTQNEHFDFCLKHFSFLRRIQRDIIIKVQRSSCIHIFLWILMKLEFSCQVIEKSSNVKYHENPSSESQVSCGQTGGLRWMNGRPDRQA